MKLNDPFGRMANRDQQGYESIRNAMRKGGVTTIEGATEVIEQSRQRGQRFLLLSAALLFLISFLYPASLPFTLTFGVLLVVFVTRSTINGKRYILRYIDEELRSGTSDGNGGH